MDYHFDTSNHRTQEVRMGRDGDEIAVFRKASFLIFNLKGRVDRVDYQMKLPAPWNGFRYRLHQDRRELASAKRTRRMHAFDEARPLHRNNLVEFELDVDGRALRWVPQDRHGLDFMLFDGEDRIGRLDLRGFEDQVGGDWQGDLQIPDDWSVAHAAFLAWLAREGRNGMSS